MMETLVDNCTTEMAVNVTGGLFNETAESMMFHHCDPGNPDFNCTRDEYLLFNRGPQTLDLLIAVPVTLMYVITFIAGIVGNAIVCIVIVRHTTMHTATNYYLFSLAVSDLIYLLFGLPNDLSMYWYQYPYVLGLPFCKMRALISEASTYVSVLTIIAFSVERYLAVCHPLHLYTMSGFRRASRIIFMLWVVSIISALPFFSYTNISYVYYPPGEKSDEHRIMESAFCAMLDIPAGFPVWEISTMVFFVIPMAVMVVLYGRMGSQIRFRANHTSVLGVQQGSQHGDSKSAQNRRAIIRMLAAVVITFFVCWAPFHLQRLLYLYTRNWEHYEMVNNWLFTIAGLFYYFSCTVNPILYNVMSNRYRVAFRETLCGKRKSFYHNGFSREAQSSMRETMISGTGGYEKSQQMARARSMRHSKMSERADNKTRLIEHIEEENTTKDQFANDSSAMPHLVTSDSVVVVQSEKNGRPQCYATPLSQPTANTMSTTATSTPTTATIVTSNGCVMKRGGGGGGGGLLSLNGGNHLSNNNNNDLILPTLMLNDNETCI